jgi:hypothetical protein
MSQGNLCYSCLDSWDGVRLLLVVFLFDHFLCSFSPGVREICANPGWTPRSGVRLLPVVFLVDHFLYSFSPGVREICATPGWTPRAGVRLLLVVAWPPLHRPLQAKAAHYNFEHSILKQKSFMHCHFMH